jgi:hypothetical protein
LPVGLEALELVEGAIEGALDAGLVAAEGGEGLGVAAEEVGQCLVGVEVGVIGFEVLPVFVVAEFVDPGFEFAAAGEAPLGHDDLVDECGFEGSDGQEMVEEGTEEVVESLFVFVEDDGVLGSEAVFEAIEANGGLAFRGFGAGAELGVAAIGGALFAGGYEGYSFGRIAREGWRFPG